MATSFDQGVGSWAREELLKYESLLRSRVTLFQSGHAATSPEVIDLDQQITDQKKKLESPIHYCNIALQSGFSDFRDAEDSDLTTGLRRYERYLKAQPNDLTQPEFQIYRRFLEEAITEIGELLSARGTNVSPADQYVEQVTAQIKKRAEIIRRLNEACEADVKTHPDQADQIRRTYRRAMDSVKDEMP
jgi:hypothetical protein